MIRAAIVGLGRWGQNLVASVQGKSDAIRFVAGATRSAEKARGFAGEHGFPLYASYEKLLADPAIDAVVLATPHTLHAGQIIAAARARKHVFAEKPFALALRDAKAAVRACAENKMTLAIGYNWRFQPALKEIKSMLVDGRLGKLLHMEGNFCGPSVYRHAREHWRQSREEGPAGGMTGRGVHLVDAMLYLSGRIESVYAQSSRAVLDFGVDGDVEHLTTWQLKLCTVDRENLHLHRRPQIITFPETSTERAELEHFAQAAMAGRPLAVADGDEVHEVAVLDAILKSARDGARARVA